MSITDTTTTPDEIADFLAKCEADNESFRNMDSSPEKAIIGMQIIGRSAKLVAMVREYQKSVMHPDGNKHQACRIWERMGNGECNCSVYLILNTNLQRILKDSPHETQTPDS